MPRLNYLAGFEEQMKKLEIQVHGDDIKGNRNARDVPSLAISKSQ